MGDLSKQYVEKMDECNQMVKDFTESRLPQEVTGTEMERIKLSKRVRHFITEQRDRATTKSMDCETAETLEEKYPTLSIVSPELKRLCALHLTHTLIETVPYLSSKYLSPDEQANIALNLFNQEFSAGEQFAARKEYGRGILILGNCFGFTVRKLPSCDINFRKGLCGCPLILMRYWLKMTSVKTIGSLYIIFARFTKVFFIPRSIIMETLENNERAWKECEEWRYVSAALILKSMNMVKSD